MFTIIATDVHYCSDTFTSYVEDATKTWKQILQDEKRLNTEHLANKARKVQAIKESINK